MNNPASIPDREPLAGMVERVTYHNPDNGYCVLRVKVRGHRDLVTVLGHAASISAGEFVQASGKWEVHREHGQQFRAAFLKSAPPSSLDGMEKYLGSGLIKGIGPVYAKKLVKAFGKAVFDVIEQQGERLTEVAGIGPKRASKIRLAWSDQKAIREIMVFLQSHGVGTSRAVRIYKTYGADAIPLMTENPYRLAHDIRGIGFKTADMIAEKLGIPKTAMIRARAGISYALLNAVDDGHCGLPRDELLKLAEELLEIPEDAINLELGDGMVVADAIAERQCVFMRKLWEAERTIAERLRALLDGKLPWPTINAAKAIEWVQTKLGVTLAESQQAAARMPLACKVVVITGGPGVGKTTLVNAILKILVAKRVEVMLAAPTGRAAKRMTEATANALAGLAPRGQAVTGFRNRVRPCDGSVRWIDWNARRDGDRIHVVTRDVTRQTSIEEMEAAKPAVLDRALFDHPLDEVLAAVCRTVERLVPGNLCTVMLANDGEKLLHAVTASSLPSAYAAGLVNQPAHRPVRRIFEVGGRRSTAGRWCGLHWILT